MQLYSLVHFQSLITYTSNITTKVPSYYTDSKEMLLDGMFMTIACGSGFDVGCIQKYFDK